MRRRYRLNRGSEFQELYRRGVRFDSKPFRVVFRENNRSQSRFAAVVNKKFGSAVQRNKAKRIARNLFQQFQNRINPPCDIVLFPKKEMLDYEYRLLSDHFEQAMEKGCRRKIPQ